MRKLLIGESDFRNTQEGNYYFVDKSLLVRDVLDSAKISLITRPRRFGKTLNLSMLRYFFSNRENYAPLFRGLAITADEEAMQHQGKYPVIYLSLKDVKGNTWEANRISIRDTLFEALLAHDIYGWEQLNPLEKQLFDVLSSRDARPDQISGLLKHLCSALERYHQQKVVILIDEYDTPLINAWTGGYYDEMVAFMRDLLGTGLKDNPHIAFAVITGITRVARESVFSGLNNLGVYTLLDKKFSQHFGFTEKEVRHLLANYGLNGREMEEVRKWYNGYTFAGQLVYNPWSLVNYVCESDEFPKSYWVLSSGNDLIKQLMFGKQTGIQSDLATLIQGGQVRKPISLDMVFSELESNEGAIWTLLLFSGYLNASDPQRDTQTNNLSSYALSIPNTEVLTVYMNKIQQWVRERAGSRDLDRMLEALQRGEVKEFYRYLENFALGVFSYYDTKGNEPESFYHAFILGLLTHISGEYEIRSNRESGYGRFDIALFPHDKRFPGIIIELKSPDTLENENIEDALQQALTQLRAKRYDTDLLARGLSRVVQIAVAVKGKDVRVAELAD